MVLVLCCAGGITFAVVAANRAADRSGNQAPGRVAGLGTPVRDGKFEFTVHNVQCGQSQVGTTLPETAAGQFCIVTLTVSNLGDQAQLYQADDQVARSANGAEYRPDGSGTLTYTVDNGQDISKNLNPGSTIDTSIVYDIPKNATIATMVLHDSPYSGGTIVRVS